MLMSAQTSAPTVLEELLDQRVLVLDGAMGTMIQPHHLTEADFQELDSVFLPSVRAEATICLE